MAASPLVELRDITKRFGGVVALDRVNMTVNPGEVMGLVGDNGAGKSTLIKVLSGAYQPSEGKILFEGREVYLSGAKAAKKLGIETVYQDLALVDTLDAPGNIFLGRELLRFGIGPIRVLNKRKMQTRSTGLLEQVGLKLDSLETEVGLLSGGQRQSVAISRALYTEPKLVMLDEPTSALAVREAEKVLDITRSLREQGITVVYISHAVRDVMDVTDRIVVLRKGRKVADLRTKDTSLEEVVEYIVGQEDREANAYV